MEERENKEFWSSQIYSKSKRKRILLWAVCFGNEEVAGYIMMQRDMTESVHIVIKSVCNEIHSQGMHPFQQQNSIILQHFPEHPSI